MHIGSGGFGKALGTEGNKLAIKFARENMVPLFRYLFVMQLATIDLYP